MKPFALVTGGCSGIGFSIAKELAARKYSLFLVSNHLAGLQKAVAFLKKEFEVECFFLHADLSLPSAAQKVYEEVLKQNLHIEILVNNAGMLVFGEVAELSVERLEKITRLHIETPTALTQLFAKEMKQYHRGFILNVSSISAVMPYPGISLYGPGKTYLRYFTKAIRHELKPHGIEVCAVLPGATETGLYNPEKVNLKLARRLGIMQSPDAVAQSAVKGLLAGKAEVIPGLLNKLTVCFLPLLPVIVISALYRKTGLIQTAKKALDD